MLSGLTGDREDFARRYADAFRRMCLAEGRDTATASLDERAVSQP